VTPDWTATQEPRLCADGRDRTPEPPAYLDPRWVLCMQRRIRNFKDTGDLEWYRPKTGGRFAPEGALNNNGGN
jgi:hypothetical protein